MFSKIGDSRRRDAEVKCPSGLVTSQRPFGPSRSRCKRWRNGDKVWQRPCAAVSWSRWRRSRDEDSRNGENGVMQGSEEAAASAPAARFVGLNQWLKLLLIPRKFRMGDEHQEYSLDHSERLLYFALCSGNHSDPAVKNLLDEPVSFVMVIGEVRHVQY
ncbi:hypothetical protein F2Q70_00027746, partial [Brassica cretica]